MVLWFSLAVEAEIGGKTEVRMDYFPDNPLRISPTIVYRPPSRLRLASRKSGQGFCRGILPFGKFDPKASSRFSGDVREAWIGYNGENSEWRAGMLTERWGVLSKPKTLSTF